MKRILLLFILTPLIIGLHGQDMNSIVPPAPEASKLAQYTFTPTNLYRGTTNLSVPLYTIDFYGMSLPISIGYNSGGIRANEDAGLVGLGWSLQHTGVISRVIMGRDDLYKNDGSDPNAPNNQNLTDGYVYNPTPVPSVPEDFESQAYTDFFYSTEAEAVRTGKADTQPDIFSLSLFGVNTKFVLAKESGGTVEVIKLTEDANRITFNKADYTFTVTTPQGFVAKFDKKARSTVIGGSNNSSDKWQACASGSVNFNLPGGIYSEGKFRTITSWYLSELSSPSGRTINFNYDIVGSDRSEYVSVSAASFGEKYALESSLNSGSVDINTGVPTTPTPEPTSCARIIHEHFYPTSIVSTDLQLNINFTKTSRVDLRKPDLGTNASEYYLTTVNTVYYDIPTTTAATFKDLQKITGITITSTSGYSGASPAFNKSITFNQSYFSTGTTSDPAHRFKRLRLDGVTIDDQVYTFEYNGGLPDKSTNGIDYWGYYNGKPATQDLLPPYTNPITNADDWGDVSFYYQHANRKADYNYAKAGTLTRIIYPTGGSTRYYYESNEYRITEGEYSTEGIAPNYVAGAFIAESTTPVFTFEDSQEEDCEYPGTLTMNLRFNSFSGGYNGPVLTADLNDYAVEILDASNNTVVSQWATWREIDESPTGMHYQESIPLNLPAGDYKVRVKRKADNNGQTLYYASVEVRLPAQCDQTLISSGTVVTDQASGGLRIAEMKNYDSRDGLVGKKRFEYTTIENGSEVSSGVLMTPLRNIYMSSPSAGSGAYAFIFSSPSQLPHSNAAMGGFMGYSQVTEINGELSSGFDNGESIKYFQNRPNDVINASAVNSFGNENGKLQYNRVLDTNDNEVLVNKYWYNVDQTNTTRALTYQLGSSANNGTVLQFATNYNLKSEFVAPYYTETIEDRGTGKVVTSQNRAYNDHFFLKSQSTVNSNGESSYMEHKYPTDYVSPATVVADMVAANVIATSLETIQKVDGVVTSASATTFKEDAGTYLPDKTFAWNIDKGAYVASSDGDSYSTAFEEIMQVVDYDDNGNPIEFVDQSGIRTAVLWGYNGNYPVAQIRNASHAQALAVLNTSVLNNPGTDLNLRNELDKLRTHSSLSGALVTTMTYLPMTGLASQTSPDGLTVFYEYDTYRRLKYIKDFEGNILKKVEYQYQETIANTTK